MIPIHPVTDPDAAVLRWVVPPGTLPVTGAVRVAPDPLARLLDDGTLAAVRVDPDAVVTRLGQGRTWRMAGAVVRTALHQSLESPADWLTDPSTHPPVAPEPSTQRKPLPCARFCPAAAQSGNGCSTGCATGGQSDGHSHTQPRRIRLASPGRPKW